MSIETIGWELRVAGEVDLAGDRFCLSPGFFSLTLRIASTEITGRAELGFSWDFSGLALGFIFLNTLVPVAIDEGIGGGGGGGGVGGIGGTTDWIVVEVVGNGGGGGGLFITAVGFLQPLDEFVNARSNCFTSINSALNS